MEYNKMLVRMENVPTDNDVDVKLLVAPEELLKKCRDRLNLNGAKSGYYYDIGDTTHKMYDGLLLNYGYGSTPEEVFERDKQEIEINGNIYYHNLSKSELRELEELFEGTNNGEQ